MELRWKEAKSPRIRTTAKIGASRHDRYIAPMISTMCLPKQDGVRVRDDTPTRGQFHKTRLLDEALKAIGGC